MKKLLIFVISLLCVTTTFAQTYYQPSRQNWSVGARVGSGFQAVAQYSFQNDNYIEGRIGMGWIDGNLAGKALTADFTILYNWRVFEMDWTPSVGVWFFDAGAGVNVGGRKDYAYVGAAGMARLGITFNDAPVTLSIDWTPIVGPNFRSYDHYETELKPAVDGAVDPESGEPVMEMVKTRFERRTETGFRGIGFANFAITCTYNF